MKGQTSIYDVLREPDKYAPLPEINEDGPPLKHVEFPFEVPDGDFHYLAGPMSFRSDSDYNIPAFREALRRLRGAGYNMCSPDELVRNVGSFEQHGTLGGLDALRADINIVLYPRCVSLICLPQWERSFGAGQIEVYLANRFDKPTFEYVEEPGEGFELVRFDYNERMAEYEGYKQVHAKGEATEV